MERSRSEHRKQGGSPNRSAAGFLLFFVLAFLALLALGMLACAPPPT